MISLQGIYKSYGTTPVLRGIVLQVHKGETVSVIGPSGSGKSTLLRCITMLDPPDIGTITVAGTTLTNPGVDLDKARAKIGVVFQHFNLFQNMTVLGNVMLGPVTVRGLTKDHAADLARTTLTTLGLSRLTNLRPNQLSGGQQQRVAIARALAMEPHVMLFDEATSALDPELVKDVLDAIRELAASGMTMIIVTHEMAFAREVSDRVVFMDHGRVGATGPPEAIFGSPLQPRLQRFLDKVL